MGGQGVRTLKEYVGQYYRMSVLLICFLMWSVVGLVGEKLLKQYQRLPGWLDGLSVRVVPLVSMPVRCTFDGL